MKGTQIPAEIQARLDMIMREAAIDSCDVQKPSRLAFIIWVIIALVLVASFLEFKKENFGLMGVLLALSCFQIAFYFHQRKLYGLYLNACAIIKYYRALEPKLQTSDSSPPLSPSGLGVGGR